MTDYTQTTDFSVKDGLPANDPEKDILGSDIDNELGPIATAIASKYDNTDIASQAQAEAGASNEVLMTPLRVAQYLGIGGSGGGSAGAIGDILQLDDPGDDRILFWDESGDEVTWLDIGTGLETTAGGVLNVTPGAVDHDSLLNFEANEHVDHTDVTITAGDGLSYSVGGTDISSSATLDVDIDGLTVEETLDTVNDTVMFYDNSASALRKVSIDALIGTELGDGKWYRTTSAQSMSTTETTVVFNAELYDNTTRGTYSTSTGVFTVGAEDCRILVMAQLRADSLNEGQSLLAKVYTNTSSLRAMNDHTTEEGFGAIAQTVQIWTVLNLSAGDTVNIDAYLNTGTDSLVTGQHWTFLQIIELA